MLITTIAADTLPVSLAEARQHCRAPENGDDDVLVLRSLRAAVEYVQRHTTLILAPTTFEYRLNEWPCYNNAVLPVAPIRDVLTVEYVDENSVTQDVAAANWSWARTPLGANVRFKSAYSFPTLTTELDDGVRITFEAGYDAPGTTGSGDDPDLTLPVSAEALVLLMASLTYENREAEIEKQFYPIKTVENMLAQLRIYR